jgi:hypothetical protein
MSRVVEIRTYRLHPGMRGTLQNLMEERCLPLLNAWGMDVVHAGPCATDPEGYVLMRAYDDGDHLRRSQDAFYGSEDWREGPREAVLACIDQYLSVVLEMDEPVIEALRSIPKT